MKDLAVTRFNTAQPLAQWNGAIGEYSHPMGASGNGSFSVGASENERRVMGANENFQTHFIWFWFSH